MRTLLTQRGEAGSHQGPEVRNEGCLGQTSDGKLESSSRIIYNHESKILQCGEGRGSALSKRSKLDPEWSIACLILALEGD